MSINFQSRHVSYQNIQKFPKYSYDLIKGAESTIENYAKHNSLSIRFMPASELPPEGTRFVKKEYLTDAVGIEVKHNLVGTVYPVETYYDYVQAVEDNKKGDSFLRTIYKIISGINHEQQPIHDEKVKTYRKLLMSNKIKPFFRAPELNQFNRFW